MDDDALFAALEDACVPVPDGAIDLFPRKVGPRIFHFPKENLILKVGPSVKMSEAEAMRFVASNTSVPVPQVLESYVKEDNGHILMSMANGEPLAKVWKELDSEGKASVVRQLRDYTQQLQALTGDFYGALWNLPCQDVFFSHLPFQHEQNLYGPYHSRQEYNQGLVTALVKSRPPGVFTTVEETLARKVQELTDETKTFSHGDLHRGNIFSDPKGRIMAILDWEGAGFSICGREYYEARARSRKEDWDTALDEIFPEKAKMNFELLKEFDQALTQYTGI